MFNDYPEVLWDEFYYFYRNKFVSDSYILIQFGCFARHDFVSAALSKCRPFIADCMAEGNKQTINQTYRQADNKQSKNRNRDECYIWYPFIVSKEFLLIIADTLAQLS